MKYITKTVVIVFQVQSQIFVISAVNLAIGAKFINATKHHPEENISFNNNYSDITLDNMIKGFISRISTLGRETRPHAAHNKDNTIIVFPIPAIYPYVPSIPSTRLSQEQAAVVQVVQETLNIENSNHTIAPPVPPAVIQPGQSSSPAAVDQTLVNNDQTQARQLCITFRTLEFTL